jgi:hypothetical protein
VDAGLPATHQAPEREPARHPAVSAFTALYPIAAFWIFGEAVTIYGRLALPGPRLLTLAVCICGIFLIRHREPQTRVLVAALAISLALLGTFRAAQAYEAVADGRVPTVDIATTTIAAVELVSEGANPYTTPIDAIGQQVDPMGEGFRFFAGFKYGPAMTWIYTPGINARGASGFYITNFALLMLALGATLWWTSAAGAAASLGAGALLLVPWLWGQQLFDTGANDVAPVALALLAFALRARGMSLVSAASIGLSMGMKLFPGVLFIAPLVLMGVKRKTFVVVAGVVAAACYLPALLRSPRELIAGVFLFNSARPPNETSLLQGLPEVVVQVAGPLAVLAAIGIAFWWNARGFAWDPGNTALLCAIAITISFVGSRQIHSNYLMWLFPMMAVALAVRVWGREPVEG